MYKLFSVLTLLVGMAALASAAGYKPGPMFESAVHQKLYTNGVSFVHNQNTDHIMILPSGDTRELVSGYDTPKAVCENLNPIRKVKKVTVHTRTTTSSAACE